MWYVSIVCWFLRSIHTLSVWCNITQNVNKYIYTKIYMYERMSVAWYLNYIFYIKWAHAATYSAVNYITICIFIIVNLTYITTFTGIGEIGNEFEYDTLLKWLKWFIDILIIKANGIWK